MTPLKPRAIRPSMVEVAETTQPAMPTVQDIQCSRRGLSLTALPGSGGRLLARWSGATSPSPLGTPAAAAALICLPSSPPVAVRNVRGRTASTAFVQPWLANASPTVVVGRRQPLHARQGRLTPPRVARQSRRVDAPSPDTLARLFRVEPVAWTAQARPAFFLGLCLVPSRGKTA